MPSYYCRGTRQYLASLSSSIVPSFPRLGIILAAGHGKRIRSETSKMLHEIWGRPTLLRVAEAVERGLDSPNQAIVVGIKAEEVAQTLGSRPGRVFAFQENPVLGLPSGTGDAVCVALEAFAETGEERDIYIFPGDMGLLRAGAVAQFRRDFENSDCQMMVLSGRYKGPPGQNYYGRIVRVPAGEDEGKLIEIKEHKDILGLDPERPYEVVYNQRTYTFSREQLLGLREINTLVLAFRERPLRHHIAAIATDNVQSELMLTDLVHLFNQNGLVVRAVPAASEEEILGFNVKSVWHRMEAIARRWAYERLMDIITIVDEEDFFIADQVVEHILSLDKDRGPLDIVVGKGAHIGPQVQLERRVHLGDDCHLSGHIVLGEGVHLGPGVRLSTYPGQTMILEEGVEVLFHNILKGNLHIGAGSRIEARVLMTGSDEHPMRLGRQVTVKGTSYLYGCRVDDRVTIEHSVLKCRHIERTRRRDGSIQPIRYVLPPPEGLDSIGDL